MNDFIIANQPIIFCSEAEESSEAGERLKISVMNLFIRESTLGKSGALWEKFVPFFENGLRSSEKGF